MKPLTCIAVLSFVAASLQAANVKQRTEEKPPTPTTANAGSNVSLPSDFELLVTRYQFEDDGTGQKEVVAKIRILNEMGTLQQAEEVFEYHPLTEELRIPYVRVRRENGTVVNIETNVVQPIPAGVEPDSDLDERRVRIPQLAVGDQIEYDSVTTIRRPLGPGQFSVQHRFQASGVLHEQLEIDVPMGRKVTVKSLPNVKFWVTVEGARKVYHWESQNPEATQIIAVPYTPGRPPDVQFSSFQSWAEVGRWYSDLEKNHRAPTAEIKAKADELTRSSKSDMEKAEALYSFAAKQIRYISLVSLGIGGSEPHSASETLHKGYGDCKDKTALLEALLEAEGLRASSVLISADRKLNFDVPSPWPFDHVITMLVIGNDKIWLDPSAAVLPFKMLAYPLRGKQSLVVSLDAVPHFEQTPIEARVPNMWSEEIEGKVEDNGTLQATVKIITRGDAELPLRQALLSPAESMWPSAVRNMVMGIDRNDRLTDIKISDPIATNEPFTLSFRLMKMSFLPALAKQSNVKLPLFHCRLDTLGGYSTVNWDNAEPGLVRLGPPRQCSYKLRIEFPEPFKLTPPSPISLTSEYASYNATYNLEGHALIANRTLSSYRDELPPSLAAGYEDFEQQITNDPGIKIAIADSAAAKK